MKPVAKTTDKIQPMPIHNAVHRPRLQSVMSYLLVENLKSLVPRQQRNICQRSSKTDGIKMISPAGFCELAERKSKRPDSVIPARGAPAGSKDRTRSWNRQRDGRKPAGVRASVRQIGGPPSSNEQGPSLQPRLKACGHG